MSVTRPIFQTKTHAVHSFFRILNREHVQTCPSGKKKTVWRCGGLMSVGKYKSQRKPRRGDVCANVYYHFRQCETLLSSKQANEKQCNVAMTTAVYFHCTRSKKKKWDNLQKFIC